MAPPPGDLPAGLAQPARRALAGARITSLKQLARHTAAEVRALHGIGPNALETLRQALQAQGLAFKSTGPKQRLGPGLFIHRKQRMRKLKLQVQVSADGYMAGPNHEMNFISRNWDAGVVEYVTALTTSMDGIVLGRKLAQGFIPHWAAVAADPQHPEHLAGVKFTATPKVVFTKTLEKSDWPNTVLAKGDLAEEINRLKAQPGQDLIAYGGVAFVTALVQHGLVDDLHLFLNPTALGRGHSVFETLERPQPLALVKATGFGCGIVVLHYAPAG